MRCQAFADVGPIIAYMVLFVQRPRDNEPPRHPIACAERLRISALSDTKDQRHIKHERVHM
ncbi:hypothetical protein C6P86_01740 [Burkholderia multivorans]|nr:hypothetical protein WM33_06305 [Burkholderia multivorans]KVZ84839.1 hypothetical protein WL23_03690 [Burkholderia multivorans]PRE73993.1 hypothetical protein C6P86_01740 [Burkholderia multivorans]PRE87600.1 hypothetical protein C6Q00_10460 [Burkholderia multivorans]PRG19877.1 hypothetical protein C6T57_19445 [Burkholderia multivorans]